MRPVLWNGGGRESSSSYLCQGDGSQECLETSTADSTRIERHRYAPSVSEHTNPKTMFHLGINCSACQGAIIGARYRCATPDDACKGVNLCESCEASPIAQHPPDHPLLKYKLDLDSCKKVDLLDRTALDGVIATLLQNKENNHVSSSQDVEPLALLAAPSREIPAGRGSAPPSISDSPTVSTSTHCLSFNVTTLVSASRWGPNENFSNARESRMVPEGATTEHNWQIQNSASYLWPLIDPRGSTDNILPASSILAEKPLGRTLLLLRKSTQSALCCNTDTVSFMIFQKTL